MPNMPDCPVCDECCEDCKECDCNSPDCEFQIKIKPEHLPYIHSGYPYSYRCCDANYEGFNNGCSGPSMTIKACCNGSCGCNDKTYKIVRWVVCNDTDRCLQVFTNFRISGLKKTPESAVCPDDNEDCCKLHYRQVSGPECGFCKSGTTCEPNGIAPGPGFCICACSQIVVCVAMRVGGKLCDCAPADLTGCKKYDDSPPGTMDCCNAQCTISEPCFQVCCTDNINDSEQNDNDGCDSVCRDVLEPGGVFGPGWPGLCAFNPGGSYTGYKCPICCGCCEPDLDDMELDGFNIISDTEAPGGTCCKNIVAELSNAPTDWICCETGTGDCSSFSANPEGNPPCDAILTAYPYYECLDGDNDGCDCQFVPVPPSHENYVQPCLCNYPAGGGDCFGSPDMCITGDKIVVQGTIDEFFCNPCYEQYEAAPPGGANSCSPSPCTIGDSANTPCPH